MNTSNPLFDAELDPELCHRARMSRDPRFDGEFFLAVSTTGIYCRPICPARAPAEKNVSYYRSADQAAQAGYRPCLRCRPESAPDSPAWRGTSTTVQRALQLIKQGALNEGKLADLAARLGIGERYLRKLFQHELGISPQAVALNQRLLFAKKLLAETELSATDVAYAAGFGSVRRFNSAVRTQFGLAPGDLRGRRGKTRAGSGIHLRLQYRPPYDWNSVLSFFERHAVQGVESVEKARHGEDGSYRRNITVQGAPASFRVTKAKGKNALELELNLPDHSQLMAVVARIRRMFDLDANPLVIAETLGKDPALAPLMARFAGIRAPGHWSMYESSLRAIVGQQVSTAAARSICSRLAAATSTDPGHLTFPQACAVAVLDDSHFPMPGRRRETVRALCRQVSDENEQPDLGSLADLKGVGPWTVAMVAMRGAGNPDIFPQKDLGLVNAWRGIDADAPDLTKHSASWGPWRSYAANLLWRSLSE